MFFLVFILIPPGLRIVMLLSEAVTVSPFKAVLIKLRARRVCDIFTLCF